MKRKKKSSLPKFKKVRRYKSFTLKQAGWKLDEARGKIRIGKKEGSNNRKRARKELARTYRKLSNQRKDFHFKTARRLCEQYAVICLETLNMRGMARRWGRKVHS